MKIFLKYLGWGCLGLILSVMNAQFAAQNMKSSSKIPVTKSLLLGEKVPDNLWFKPLKIINGTKETLSLSDFKESLVILEFWASNCSACLKNIPKVAEINNQFKDSAIILPVSEQPKNAIAKFFEGEYGRNYKDLISVTDDSILGKYFPHYGVPYLVWIYDGKVMSTTDAGQLSAESVSDILQEKKSSLKNIQQMDASKPLFLKESYFDNDATTLQNYFILSKGAVNGIGSGSSFRKSPTGAINGRMFSNLPLGDILFAIGLEIFKQKGEVALFNEKRAVINVADQSKIFQLTDDYIDKDNLYSLDLIVPEKKADSLYYFMLDNLNRYTGIKSKFKVVPTKCLVLKRTSEKDKIRTKGGKRISTFPRTPSIIQNAPLSVMVNMLNGKTPISLPIIDETNYTSNVDIQISSVTTIEKLQKELLQYDLELIEASRNLLTLIVEDNNQKQN